MLNYLDNYDYSRGKESDQTTDKLIEQYYQIYSELKQKILREIKLKELAITNIAPDLLRLLKSNPKKLEILLYQLQNPHYSYAQIGHKVGLTKQRIHIILRGLGDQCYWVKNLLDMKSGK